MQLTRSAPAAAGSLAVTVNDIRFLGNNVHVATRTARGDALAVRLPFGHEAISSLRRGDTVWLGFDPTSAHVFC
jgi:putative spermidine/putrescine transport system ATP-binding protein